MAKEENNAPAGAEGAEAGKKDPNSELYEGAEPKKIIRLITVMAYMFSVSFMGIALSAYYLFLWEPPNPRLIQRTHHLSAEPQAESLIGEPGLNLNHSADQLASETYSEYVPSNLLGNSIYLQNSESNYQKSTGGWNSTDQLAGDGTVDNNHRKMNASLALLRNTLIDILKRNRADANGTTRADAKVSNDASLTVDVPLRTISGSEASKDRFTSGRRTQESSSRINHLEYNSIVPTDVTHGTVEESTSTIARPIKRNKKFRRREAPDDNPRQKVLLHTKRAREVDRSEISPGWRASSPKPISIAITYGDTQIDNVTKASMTEDDHPGELGTGGTQTESDNPTTLADSVLLGRIYSATSMWNDSEYTPPSLTPDSTENNATDQSIVFSTE